MNWSGACDGDRETLSSSSGARPTAGNDAGTLAGLLLHAGGDLSCSSSGAGPLRRARRQDLLHLGPAMECIGFFGQPHSFKGAT